jgi:hypothetical protein
MKENRLFNLVVILALAAMAALTISQAMATNRLVAAASNGGTAADEQCSALGVDRSSIHMVYVEQARTWLPYTKNAPTGVDGGLLQLLSERQACSQ